MNPNGRRSRSYFCDLIAESLFALNDHTSVHDRPAVKTKLTARLIMTQQKREGSLAHQSSKQV